VDLYQHEREDVQRPAEPGVEQQRQQVRPREVPGAEQREGHHRPLGAPLTRDEGHEGEGAEEQGRDYE